MGLTTEQIEKRALTTEQIEKRAEEALTFLADTDEEAASLKFEAAKAEHRYKSMVDAHFLSNEGNIEERKASGRTACEADYLLFLEAQRQYDSLKNKRDREALVIEWLRSLCANRRQG